MINTPMFINLLWGCVFPVFSGDVSLLDPFVSGSEGDSAPRLVLVALIAMATVAARRNETNPPARLETWSRFGYLCFFFLSFFFGGGDGHRGCSAKHF